MKFSRISEERNFFLNKLGDEILLHVEKESNNKENFFVFKIVICSIFNRI